MVIAQMETTELCDTYESDVLGLIQNDPRYAEIINDTGDLNNMLQKHLEHHLLTAAATVDGNNVNMPEDNGSINTHAPLTVVNTSGFDAPGKGRVPVTVLLRICAMWRIMHIMHKHLELLAK